MPLEQLPFWAQLGIAGSVIFVLVIGAGTKRFGRLWVFGWVYDAKEREAEEWKDIALKAMGNTAAVTSVAKQHTTLTPEEADRAMQVIRDAGYRLGPDA